MLKSWFGGAEFSQLLLVCKAFDFSFIFDEILAGYSNLGCRFFSFITLNMSWHLSPWVYPDWDSLFDLGGYFHFEFITVYDITTNAKGSSLDRKQRKGV